MAERDYTKFLKNGSRLHMRLIPRPTWVEMVAYAQREDDIIVFVLDEMYWLFDLQQLIAKAEADGKEVNRAELLQELMGEMSDSDWWKLTSAFEEHIMRSYADNPERWATFLDPVYDLQEREGWRERQ